VPKCEIFDRLDFHDFYTIKSLRAGDFVVFFFNIQGFIWDRKIPYAYAQSNFKERSPSKHAEHTHQGLMRTLSIRVRWTDAFAEHTHQFLMGMLSIGVKITNLKKAFKSCWAYSSGTDACTEHACKELTRMLSICISSLVLRVCSACASETKWGLAPSKIKIIS
jgi:hypothetical protein